jgi:TRAP-type C4-dicarboxylate transport system permease small subunit
MVITLRSATPVWLEQAPELELEYSTGRRLTMIWVYVAMPLFVVCIIIAAVAGFR